MKQVPESSITMMARIASPARQTGAVLIVSLIMLLVMTLLGLTAISSTTLQEKMAGSMRDRNVALQASEAALKSAETIIAGLSVKPSLTTNCNATTCAWPLNTLPDVSSQSAAWWQSNGLEYGAQGTRDISDAGSDPRYVVEEQAFLSDNKDIGQDPDPPGARVYRITTRGTGASADAQVILQSTYAARF